MFENKKVVVTGGAGALGSEIVAWFSTRGAQVAVIDYSQEIIDDAFAEKQPGNLYITADLTDRASCAAATDSILEGFGSIDVLCNIAGGFMMGDPVHETSDRVWDFLFDLNARSVMNMAAAVVPGMQARGGGKIVNVAARAGLEGEAMMGAYTASKSAVLRLTESMGKELRENNINVNCVMPSLIDTPRNRQDMPGADFDRWVKPSEIARVVGFLASDDAACIHGAGIPVVGLS